MFTLS